MDVIDRSVCEKCGHESYYIWDKRELREENDCLNEKCGFFKISFEKGSDFVPKGKYLDFLNGLESKETDKMKDYWGFSSPSEVRKFIEEN